MEKNVEAWFDTSSNEQKPILLKLRELVLATDENFAETIKWGQPCYSLNSLVCYLQKAKTHVTLGFQKGAYLNDSLELLEGSGKDMRHIKIALTDEINFQPLKALLKEAVKYDTNHCAKELTEKLSGYRGVMRKHLEE